MEFTEPEQTVNYFDIEKITKQLCEFELDECVGTIYYGKELEFKFINFQEIDLSIYQLDPIDIFKFNIHTIVEKLKNYFEDIEIKLNFDIPNRNESILKKYDNTFKHDIYISMSQTNKYFDCAFDFINRNTTISTYKNICSLVNLDYYKYFDESLDKFDKFIEECIYRMLLLGFTITDDEYKFAEILYVGTHSNGIQPKTLDIRLGIFRKFMNGKKMNEYNFYEFYQEIMPINPKTGKDLDYNKFIKYIEENIFNNEKQLIIHNNMINMDDFESILLELNSDVSNIVKTYKSLYKLSNIMLITSLKKILELSRQINKTKKYTTQYIKLFMENDIVNIDDIDLQEEIYEKLKIIYE